MLLPGPNRRARGRDRRRRPHPQARDRRRSVAAPEDSSVLASVKRPLFAPRNSRLCDWYVVPTTMSVKPSPFRSRALITRAMSGSIAEHLTGGLLETHAWPGIQEDLIRFRRSRRRVVAAVGEEQVGPSIAIEVGNLNLVGPVLCLADRRCGFVHPQPSNRGRRLSRRIGRFERSWTRRTG